MLLQDLALMRPKIVCLCGSTKFKEVFQQTNKEETLKGNIVLSVGAFPHTDDGKSPEVSLGEDVKAMLDRLHLKKIELADEVLILNVGGYIGKSTLRELAYARFLHKDIRFLELDIGMAARLELYNVVKTFQQEVDALAKDGEAAKDGKSVEKSYAVYSREQVRLNGIIEYRRADGSRVYVTEVGPDRSLLAPEFDDKIDVGEVDSFVRRISYGRAYEAGVSPYDATKPSYTLFEEMDDLEENYKRTLFDSTS